MVWQALIGGSAIVAVAIWQRIELRSDRAGRLHFPILLTRMNYTRLLVVLVALLAIVVVVTALLHRMCRNPILRDRERLKVEQIFRQYYAMTDLTLDRFRTAWSLISSELMADPGRLRPTDRLFVDLKPLPVWLRAEDERAVLVAMLGAHCKRVGIEYDPKHLESVNDCVILYCQVLARADRDEARHA